MTLDSGAHWTRLTGNLPTTLYDDIVVHPRTKDLILATHGRSIWILDDASPIAEWSDAIASRGSYLFPTRRATLMQYWDDVSNMAQGFYAAENPADGAAFTYYLSRPAQKVRLHRSRRERQGHSRAAGQHLGGRDSSRCRGTSGTCRRRRRSAPGRSPKRAVGGGGGEGGGAPQRSRDATVPSADAHDIGVRGPFVAPGTFTVTLDVDGDTTSRHVRGARRSDAHVHTGAATRARGVPARRAGGADRRRAGREPSCARAARRRRASDSARYVALERRLTAGRNAPRAKLGAVARAFNGQGAQQGSFAPPSAVHRQALAEAKSELIAVKKELGGP